MVHFIFLWLPFAQSFYFSSIILNIMLILQAFQNSATKAQNFVLLENIHEIHQKLAWRYNYNKSTWIQKLWSMFRFFIMRMYLRFFRTYNNFYNVYLLFFQLGVKIQMKQHLILILDHLLLSVNFIFSFAVSCQLHYTIHFF